MLKVSTAKEKKVDWLHGVSFVVRRFTLRRRQKAVADAAEAAERWRVLSAERDVLKEAVEPDTERIGVIEAELTKINREQIVPAYFRHGLISIEGLEIDGQPATAEMVQRLAAEIEADDWPDVFHDILAAILGEFNLEESEAGESGPPTTSPS